MRCQRGWALKSPGSSAGGLSLERHRAVAAHLAGHLDVAAERDCGDLVFGVAALEAEQAFAEANGEDFDADAAKLGYSEVAEFVDQNHDAKDDGKLDDCRHGE